MVSSGADQLTGGSGADRFEFKTRNFGADTITDFNRAEGDRIRIIEASRFSQLSIAQAGDDTVIAFAQGSIRLLDMDAGSVTSGAFLFG